MWIICWTSSVKLWTGKRKGKKGLRKLGVIANVKDFSQ